jgi:CDP-paratose 2-epimerase
MKVFITGGAGFIGCNAAARFIKKGHDVTVFDNLSRPGTPSNLKWLQQAGRFKFIKGDVRDRAKVAKAVKGVKGLNAVLHYAGQVAVTTSVVDPREDFDINALGTFNVLEAVRLAQPKAQAKKIALLYSSTNKVYGGMEDIKVVEKNGRYQYRDLPQGIPEGRLLDFHSPYGCSKGAADQYVLDYARSFGLPAAVLLGRSLRRQRLGAGVRTQADPRPGRRRPPAHAGRGGRLPSRPVPRVENPQCDAGRTHRPRPRPPVGPVPGSQGDRPCVTPR